MYTLMIKQCVETGLKYLCKTSKKDPYSYKGSGKYWRSHIKAHNGTIITCVIGQYNTSSELKEAGIYYSTKHNVVESEEWANLVPEQGDGGWINDQTGKTWKIKDTSNMGSGNRGKPMSKNRKEKTKGDKNWQCKGYYITPWGEFSTLSEVVTEAKLLREQGSKYVITDHETLRCYCKKYNNRPLNKEGRRTPANWRGKTPKEIGFGFKSKDNI